MALSYNQDQYRSHTPFAFVLLGGIFTPIQSYDLSKTNRGEASSCKISIPLENIDTKIFTETENKDEYVEVLIYFGYLIDTVDPQDQIKEFLSLIDSKKAQTQSRFAKRFDGFVSQPEWKFGMTRTLTINCFDWSQILREYKWEENIKDGNVEVTKVIALVQAKLKGINIIADSYSGSLKLGEIDQESKKHSFNCSGKTYFEILEECAKKMNKNVIVDGKNIYITDYKKQPVIWSFYYGAKNSPVYTSQESLTPFETATLRYGEVGERQRTSVVVDLFSRTTSKKGKNSATKVRYPENSTVGSLTKYIKRNLKNNLSENELKVLAENIHKHETKKVMTGNIDVLFANPFIDLYDLATFVADNDNPDLGYMKDTNFSINSITENYSIEGCTQNFDIDSSQEIVGRLTRRKAPVLQTSNSKPIYSLNSYRAGDTSILDRRL